MLLLLLLLLLLLPPFLLSQDDNFLPTMTVSETCTFYATLLLPNSTSKAQRQERIAEVLAAMGLAHTVDTLVREVENS